MGWTPPQRAAWTETLVAGDIPPLTDDLDRPFVAEVLIGEARGRTGLTDLGEGDPDFREGLDRLLYSLEHEANLDRVGRWWAHTWVARLLDVRLQIARYVQDDPGVLDEAIERPIFVTGGPRTGTSILHALLAQDPANRVPTTWEFLRPVPPPEPRTRAVDPRIALAEREIRFITAAVPVMDAIHDKSGTLPKECISAHALAFRSEDFTGQFAIPGYAAWLAECDMRPAYTYHRLVLQILQRRTPGDTRWVLKSPAHLLTLDALVDVYPDARLAVTHRDPLTVLASLSSLIATIHHAYGNPSDIRDVARTQTDLWCTAYDRLTAFRDAGRIAESDWHDSAYADFMRDPIAVVRELYATFGLDLDGEAERRMRDHLAARPQGRHGRHTYSFDDLGLDRAGIRSRLTDYQKRFRVPTEEI
ncbi:sulfotransferase family protein [Embleya sp. NBC_00896]|uniref:sulfotransferase family protein n=1 Tax=Embleya sp. NBC_00896 TaxID=2975961 RepID=UPI003862DFA4|nr:sulfotransferase [Embleya sp. NBC_00896]